MPPQGPSPRVRGKHPKKAANWAIPGSIPARAGETSRPPRSCCPPSVHPRACGGNPARSSVSSSRAGPSPRVRGKHNPCALHRCPHGSIPARAGETRLPGEYGAVHRVHPRACGGNQLTMATDWCGDGPSPRVRGKRGGRAPRCGRGGSIPARAGETGILVIDQREAKVHPRACGGNDRSPPRGPARPGPSPRVRGKRREGDEDDQIHGSIPARAGETLPAQHTESRLAVHPRACGGNDMEWADQSQGFGPSPRVRGKPLFRQWALSAQGSIPARAGETRPRKISQVRPRVHPRACGGNDGESKEVIENKGPSPRVRGKRSQPFPARDDLGSIPARAGETCRNNGSVPQIRVHPRACGGNSLLVHDMTPPAGPSPRVRGKRP